MPTSPWLAELTLATMIGERDWWVAVSVAQPSDATGTGFEDPDDASYARVFLEAGTSWEEPADVAIQNAVAVTFPTAAADYEPVVVWGLSDSPDTGDPVSLWEVLAVPRTVLLGEALLFNSGTLVIGGITES